MGESSSSGRLYDAHCHLQDPRLAPFIPELVRTLGHLQVARVVVNGTSEPDWERTLALASAYPTIVPALGLHPWFARDRSVEWMRRLTDLVTASGCSIGEIGLDRWMQGYDSADQEAVFVEQLRLAARLNRPVSIHCLRAWGRMLEILQTEPRPSCGFLLHSYAGPAEMVRPFCDLGAYFSVSGYFAHPRKLRQRETFRRVPLDRLLVETDAPDLLPPVDLQEFTIMSATDDQESLNHPANIQRIYRWAAELVQQPLDPFTAQVETNFQRLFGRIRPVSP